MDTQAAMYIGEICRYLLAAPERPEEKTHKIRMMFGNGMRPQIWENFSKRFNVPLICELYAATEGNANVRTSPVTNSFGLLFLSSILRLRLN